MATLITNPSNSPVNLPPGFFQDAIGPHEGVIVSDPVADVTSQLAGLGLTAATVDTGSGDVAGPGSSTDNALARWDGATGALLQNSGWTLSDAGNMLGVSTTVIGNVLDLTFNSVTSGNGVLLRANSMTAGTMLQVIHDSPEPIQLRSVVRIDQTAPTAAQCIGLYIGQAAPFVGLWLGQDANGNAIRIPTSANTTEHVVNIPSADSLTTGGILNLVSNSASTGVRNLVSIVNDNAAATATTALFVQQDSTGPSIVIQSAASAFGSSTTETRFGDRTIRFRQNPGQQASAGVIVYDPAGGVLSLTGAGTTVGNRIVGIVDAIQLSEFATVPGGSPVATVAKIWVRDDAPNRFVFTGDTGVDHVLEDSRTLGSEIETGKTWTAGQTIFKQAFGYSNVPAGAATVIGTMSVSPAQVVAIYGSHIEAGFRLPFPAYAASSNVFNATSYTSGASVIAEIGSSRSGTNSGIIVVEFTKV